MSRKTNLADARCTKLSINSPVEMLKKDQEKDGDFIITAYTGAVVDRWWGKLAIEVDGIEASDNMPIFRDHMRGKIVGYANKAWKDTSFFVSGYFSDATEHAKETRALADEGFPWQASIGVTPKKILSLEPGEKRKVNGKELEGPAEIWLESNVLETSFVPFGADGSTGVEVFSDFVEAEQASIDNAGQPAQQKKEHEMSNEGTAPVMITVESLRQDHPDMVSELMAEGAKAERCRIQAVLEQSMPGHDALIQSLAFDGKTTGPEAAVQVLKAEKQAREKLSVDAADDAIAPVAVPSVPEGGDSAELSDDAPVDERAKVSWDKDAKLRNEFNGKYETYLAYFKAVDNNSVKVLNS